LWSHIKFGDTLEGCRFLSENKLNIGNDVWFVGHCIVSPIIAEDKSMAMVGSVVTKNMEFNQIYAGSPAKSISDKIGFQFQEVSLDLKIRMMLDYLDDAKVNKDLIKIVANRSEIKKDGRTYFVVESREYLKTGSPDEISFMKFLLPAKAKFIPLHDTI
jgi:hypothetical protein